MEARTAPGQWRAALLKSEREEPARVPRAEASSGALRFNSHGLLVAAVRSELKWLPRSCQYTPAGYVVIFN